ANARRDTQTGHRLGIVTEAEHLRAGGRDRRDRLGVETGKVAADDDDIRAAGAAVGQQLHLVGGTGDDRDVIDVAEQFEEDEVEFEVDGQQHLGHHCSPPVEATEGAPTTDSTLCPSRAASTSDRSAVPTKTSMRAPSPVPKLPTSRLI